MLEGEDEEERRRKTRRTRRNATGGEFGHGTRAGGSHYGTRFYGQAQEQGAQMQIKSRGPPGLPASQPFAPGRSNPDTSDRCFCGEDVH